MGDEAVFHQLFVTRVAMFALFLLSLGVVINEGLVTLSTPSGAPTEELIFWSCVGVVLLTARVPPLQPSVAGQAEL